MSDSATSSNSSSNALFQASPTPAASAGSVLQFIFAAVLIFGGFWLMGSAFGGGQYDIWIFSAGLLADVIGFYIAFGINPGHQKARGI